MEILTSTEGQRFAVLDDDPKLLCPINEEWRREMEADGMHPSNALTHAVQAPYRVTWGFGVHEDFATLEAALEKANELSDGWLLHGGRLANPPKGTPAEALRYDICGPEVLRRLDEPIEHEWGREWFQTIHRPTHGEFYAEAVPEAVAA